MKKNFEEVYNSFMNSNNKQIIEAMNQVKKDRKKRIILAIILCTIADICLFIRMYSLSISDEALVFSLLIMIMIDIGLILISCLFFNKGKNKLKSIFKQKVIAKLLNNFYDDVKYTPTARMPRNIYDEGRYEEEYDIYRSDDFMKAMINNKYPIKMAEVHTIEEVESTDSDGHTTTTEYTKFHGLFGVIEMEKSINNDLFIFQGRSFFDKKRLEMDSEDFEKIFDVKSKNNIITMQLLTHDVMALLVDFYNKTKIKFDIGIYNNKIYFRFKTGEIFELKSIRKGIYDRKPIEKYFNILEFVESVTNLIIKIIEDTEI